VVCYQHGIYEVIPEGIVSASPKVTLTASRTIGRVSQQTLTLSSASVSDAVSHGNARATIMLSKNLPKGTRTRIVRGNGSVPTQLIILDPSASPEDLTLAVGTLNLMRVFDAQGISIDRDGVHGGKIEHNSATESYQQIMTGYLKELNKATVTAITGYGDVKSLDIEVGPTPVLRQHK
jgi:hypothetical protein